MNKVNIGVDIEDIERFKNLDFNKNKSFFDRVYTGKELEYCLSKTNPYPHLAARFAGKEAVIKLISAFGRKVSPNEIEILNNTDGVPEVRLNKERFSRLSVVISLSHSKDRAIAFAWGIRHEDN